MCFWRSNPRPHTCEACTLPTKLPLQFRALHILHRDSEARKKVICFQHHLTVGVPALCQPSQPTWTHPSLHLVVGTWVVTTRLRWVITTRLLGGLGHSLSLSLDFQPCHNDHVGWDMPISLRMSAQLSRRVECLKDETLPFLLQAEMPEALCTCFRGSDCPTGKRRERPHNV